MSVRKNLLDRDRYYISLREVILRMTMVDGASESEAATLLYRLMSDASNPLRPKWKHWDRLTGMSDEDEGGSTIALECLEQAAHQGLPKE